MLCPQVIKERSSLTVAESSESPWSDDILWVLTVPAIWSDQAKQFMREAAIQVCITFFVKFYDEMCYMVVYLGFSKCSGRY